MVDLTVYNLKGQLVRILVDKNMSAGKHSINWDGKDEANHNTSSGIYLYQLKAGETIQTKRILLIK